MDGTPLLTVGERIVVHLGQFAPHADAYVCPRGMAQVGIAESLGISRAHAAIELKRQREAGRVDVRIAHVTGLPTRRKVYHLTPRGEAVARLVRDRATRRTVEIVLADGRLETVSGARALELLRRHGVGEGRAVLLVLTRARLDIRDPALRRRIVARATSAEARARAAFRRRFQDPVAWQLTVVLGPPHVPPVPAAA